MFHSVRARLTLWYTGILALVLVTFSGISYVVLAREIRVSTDKTLVATAREFSSAFANDPLETARRDMRLDYRYSDRESMVFSTDGRLVAATPARMCSAA